MGLVIRAPDFLSLYFFTRAMANKSHLATQKSLKHSTVLVFVGFIRARHFTS
jgi:hypothetical protein